MLSNGISGLDSVMGFGAQARNEGSALALTTRSRQHRGRL
jgi:hypothetical protein